MCARETRYILYQQINEIRRCTCMANNFGALDVLNLTLQGKDVHKLFVQDKVEAMVIKHQR